MKTASLALFVLSLSFSAVSLAGPCAPAVDELMALRDTRKAVCEDNGLNHPDCVAQEAYEHDYIVSVIQQCPANSIQCKHAHQDFVIVWGRRHRTCQNAGSLTDPACVTAQALEDNRFYPFGSCLLNDW